MKLYTKVIYKGITLQKNGKSFWVRLNEDGKICGYYQTLRIAKQYIDGKVGK